MSVVEEIARRRLIQTAALYVAVAWGGTEILAFLIESLLGGDAANAARRYLAILLIAGFPASAGPGISVREHGESSARAPSPCSSRA